MLCHYNGVRLAGHTRRPHLDLNMPMTHLTIVPLVTAAALLLAGCDQINQRLGLEEQGKKEARIDGEGRAVGSACRQSGRAIEDCYAIYSWLPKASVFAGWREMNDYMMANNLQVVEPKLAPAPPDDAAKRKKLKAAESAVGEEAKTETQAKPEIKTEAQKTVDTGKAAGYTAAKR
jgi:hypothetical protein